MFGNMMNRFNFGFGNLFNQGGLGMAGNQQNFTSFMDSTPSGMKSQSVSSSTIIRYFERIRFRDYLEMEKKLLLQKLKQQMQMG